MREAIRPQKKLRIISAVVNDELLHESRSVGEAADLPYLAFLLMSNVWQHPLLSSGLYFSFPSFS